MTHFLAVVSIWLYVSGAVFVAGDMDDLRDRGAIPEWNDRGAWALILVWPVIVTFGAILAAIATIRK
ncbi:hypothetical protein [Oricola sp.]|uniref:hypothetical protein n=1 Tax=Oricola sp. TaxID=1979950 RepID=UPI003BA8F048